MAIPSVNMLSNEAGGGLNAAMRANNTLANENVLRQINQVKKQYLPTTLSAEAASKLAYANLMGPQFLAKLLGNDAAVANMGDSNAKNALGKAVAAGMGQGTGGNYLSQMQQGGGSPTFSGVGQPSTNNFSGYFQNALKNVLGSFGANKQQQSPNPFAQMGGQQPMPQQAPQQQSMPQAQASNPQVGDTVQGEGSNDPEFDEAYAAWMKTPEAQREFAKGEKANIPEPEALKSWWRNINGKPMQLDLLGGQQPEKEKTWAEKTGQLKGTVKEGEELGKHNADNINEIGQQQLQLSNTGANLDRIVNDINDPKFMDLRKDFPFYQDMQLTALSKIGNPEQQEMIGNFIADVKSFAGATVNSFKGQSMKREFDYADQLKPNENDTVSTARGKLTALKSLKEIAERKNDIMLDLMQNKHMSIGDAVKQANKMVDIKAIDKEVKKLTSPMISLKNPKTGITIRLPLWEARKRGVKNV